MGRNRDYPKKKGAPAHAQAELGLSHMCSHTRLSGEMIERLSAINEISALLTTRPQKPPGSYSIRFSSITEIIRNRRIMVQAELYHAEVYHLITS